MYIYIYICRGTTVSWKQFFNIEGSASIKASACGLYKYVLTFVSNTAEPDF